MTTQLIRPTGHTVNGTVGLVNGEYAYDELTNTSSQQYGIYPYIGSVVYAFGGTKQNWSSATVQVYVSYSDIPNGEQVSLKFFDETSLYDIANIYYDTSLDSPLELTIPGWDGDLANGVGIIVETSSNSLNTQAIIHISEITLTGTVIEINYSSGKKSAATSY